MNSLPLLDPMVNGTRSSNRQRTVSARHRSGDHTLYYKCNAMEMF